MSVIFTTLNFQVVHSNLQLRVAQGIGDLQPCLSPTCTPLLTRKAIILSVPHTQSCISTEYTGSHGDRSGGTDVQES